MPATWLLGQPLQVAASCEAHRMWDVPVGLCAQACSSTMACSGACFRSSIMPCIDMLAHSGAGMGGNDFGGCTCLCRPLSSTNSHYQLSLSRDWPHSKSAGIQCLTDTHIRPAKACSTH